jgi:hypothetical protein
MTNHQHNVNLALAKYPKAKKVAVENATFGISKWDLATSMNVAADKACYKWNAHTVSAIKWVIDHYAEETLAGAQKCGNRGFVLPKADGCCGGGCGCHA